MALVQCYAKLHFSEVAPKCRRTHAHNRIRLGASERSSVCASVCACVCVRFSHARLCYARRALVGNKKLGPKKSTVARAKSAKRRTVRMRALLCCCVPIQSARNFTCSQVAATSDAFCARTKHAYRHVKVTVVAARSTATGASCEGKVATFGVVVCAHKLLRARRTVLCVRA